MRTRLFFSIFTLFTLSAATAEQEIPTGGELLTEAASLSAYSDPAHGKAHAEDGIWRVDISRPDDARPYVTQVSIGLPGADLASGQWVLAVIRARAIRGEAPGIEAKLQLAGAPYTALANTVGIDLSREWRELPVLFPVTVAAGKGTASLTLMCARQDQAIEIASIRAFRYPAGTDTRGFPRIRRTYEGREPEAAWRKAALERIERHRKTDLSLLVKGPNGEPLADCEVTLILRRHEFGFGSAVTAGLLTADSSDGRRYREVVDRWFSRVVFENDLKDFGWESRAWGKEEKLKQLDRAFDWLGERGIAVRGHYLIQDAVPPNLAKVKDAAAIRRHFIQTAGERLAFARDRVCEWDVVNHPVAWGGADLLTRRPGLERIDREIYSLAQGVSPLPFYVNEDQLFRPGAQCDGTFEYIRKLKEEGFRVDGVGNQAHVDESYLPTPEHVLAVSDRFASLVQHQVISEFDITTIDDEELAADYTRDLMIACFSHPSYTGFLLWGFWEGSHWKPEAASWSRDWTIRKRGEVLEEWLGRRWVTKFTARTGKDGVLRWRGFPGRYSIERQGVPAGGATFFVGKAQPAGLVELP